MEQLFIVFLVLVTTTVAYLSTVRSQRTSEFMAGVRAFVDYVGLCVLFLGFNLGAGLALILIVRGVTPLFVPLYHLESVFLLFFSAAQAFVFQSWWRRDRQAGGYSGS